MDNLCQKSPCFESAWGARVLEQCRPPAAPTVRQGLEHVPLPPGVSIRNVLLKAHVFARNPLPFPPSTDRMLQPRMTLLPAVASLHQRLSTHKIAFIIRIPATPLPFFYANLYETRYESASFFYQDWALKAPLCFPLSLLPLSLPASNPPPLFSLHPPSSLPSPPSIQTP